MINRSITGTKTRYGLTPIGGGAEVQYDVTYKGTVINAGTKLKDTVLISDAVAADYGLDGAKNITDPTNPLFASPNNAFAVIRAELNGLLDFFYPVGTIYQTDTIATAEDMTSHFGGVWEAWGAGKVPVGLDGADLDFNLVNKNGGSKTAIQAHTHTTPDHTHTANNTTATNNTTIATNDNATATNNVATAVNNSTTPTNVAATSDMASGGGGTSGSTTPGVTGGPSTNATSSDSHTHTFSDTTSSDSHDHTFWYKTQQCASGTSASFPVPDPYINNSRSYIGAESHTHTVSGTTSSDAHTHTLSSHTHTSAAHTHTTPAHTHTMNAHNHTQNAHTHTQDAHNHTQNSHTHTQAAHTHTQAAHNHTILSAGVTVNSTGTTGSTNLQPYQVCYFWKRTA